MSNWLDDLVDQHKELESPTSFWRWSGIAALSAVLKDQVWIDRQIYKLYPNIYVMLHAESGMKKGPPISMAKQLVKSVNNTKIISGRSSVQGILKEMGSSSTQPGGKVVMKSHTFICSSELSSSLVEDPVATKILTDLYDRQYNQGDWKSLLKMETFSLVDPTVTMLSATNEAMGEELFTRSAIQGGFFARTFIVYERDSQTSNSLVYPLSKPIDYSASSEYLKEVGKLKGPFLPIASLDNSNGCRFKKVKNGRDIYFNHVGIIYDDWYDEFKETVKSQEVKDETGTLNRFGDSVLKVAMLLSLANKPELILTVSAMEDAISSCEKLLGNVRKTTLGKHGMSNSSLLKTLIIMEFINRDNHQVTRTVLMKKMWMHYQNSQEFDDMMTAFEGAGMITINSIPNNILYCMPDSQYNELKKFMEGKSKK